MPLLIHINKATPEDAPALAGLAARTFRDAFEADNNPQDMAAYLSAAFSVSKMGEELHDPSSSFWLAYCGDLLIGYTKLRVGTPPDCVTGKSPVELERIYVDQSCIGKGYGGALMQRVIEEARAAGYKTIWLGVWKENPTSIAFYKKWGYEIVGEHEFVVGEDVQFDHLMARSL